MEYLQYAGCCTGIVTGWFVLNLIINGIPSILKIVKSVL